MTDEQFKHGLNHSLSAQILTAFGVAAVEAIQMFEVERGEEQSLLRHFRRL